VRKALLDTDIFSEVAKGRMRCSPTRVRYTSTLGPLTISTVTVVEVNQRAGARVGREPEDRSLHPTPRLEVNRLTPWPPSMRPDLRRLERLGQPIGRADPMIAASRSPEAWSSSPATAITTTDRAGRAPIEIDDWRVRDLRSSGLRA